jgi:hypothetical protein
MCPACFTTAALVFAGASSAGGLTALAVKKLRAGTQTGRRRLGLARITNRRKGESA